MIYEFICQCGNVFERKFSFKDIVDTTRCPKCGCLAQRRMYPVPHIWKDKDFASKG